MTTAVEAANRAGVSYRQVDYWFRRGFLSGTGDPPPETGSGNERPLSVMECRRLDLLVQLVAVGVKPGKAAEYARAMVAEGVRSINLGTRHGRVVIVCDL